jgi:iron complex transport system substrate-binding protein
MSFRRSSRWLGATALLSVLLGTACDEPIVQGEPQRIVALAPSVTETLFVLGLGDRVVGVGNYSTWPVEAVRKPRLGGLFDVSLEGIMALEPDLAILLRSEDELRIQLERLGVEVLTVESETIADIQQTVRSIGERCGVNDAAEEFLRQFEIDLMPHRVGGAPTVVITMGRRPRSLSDILVAGPGTYLHELLVRLGAFNAFADAPITYPQVGLEEILGRRPDAIVELQPSPGSIAWLKQDWAAFPEQQLAGSGCVQVVAGDHVLVPGPRLPRFYQELRRALVDCVRSR